MDSLEPFYVDESNLSDKLFLGLTIEELVFLGILAMIILIILLSNKPMISPAIDSIHSDLANNSVTDFVMTQFSTTYVLMKKDDELNTALKALKTPIHTSSTLRSLKTQIDSDIEYVIKKEMSNDLIKNASLESIEGGKRLRPIIAYSIVNRLRKLTHETDKGKLMKLYDIRNLNAIELLHSASLIIDDIMDQDDYRRGNLAIHKAYDLNIAMMTASQMTITALKLVGQIDQSMQRNVIESMVKERVEAAKRNSKELPINNEFYATYDLINSVLNGTSDLIDGQIMDLYEDSKALTLETIQKKTSTIYQMIFEMAWVVGGGPIREDYILFIKDMANDFGILFQIYDDFSDYYSDQIDTKTGTNYVISMGVDEAYKEFFYRVSSFVNKAEHLQIMTNAIKHIINYLSDSVTLAHKLILTDKKKKNKKKSDIDEDDLTELDDLDDTDESEESDEDTD